MLRVAPRKVYNFGVSSTVRGVRTMATSASRPLFATINVNSVDDHVEYYTKHFGMKLLERDSAALLGYGQGKFAVRVQEGPKDSTLDLGTGFGHFGIVLPVCVRLSGWQGACMIA